MASSDELVRIAQEVTRFNVTLVHATDQLQSAIKDLIGQVQGQPDVSSLVPYLQGIEQSQQQQQQGNTRLQPGFTWIDVSNRHAQADTLLLDQGYKPTFSGRTQVMILSDTAATITVTLDGVEGLAFNGTSLTAGSWNVIEFPMSLNHRYNVLFSVNAVVTVVGVVMST